MDDVAIHAGKVLVGTGEIVHDVTIGVTNGRIREVTEGEPTEDYDRAVDCSEHVVMPGLVDAHVHLVYDGSVDDTVIRDETDGYLSVRAAGLAQDSLHAGVTTLGDMACKGSTVVALRNATTDGAIVGPRIRACGPMIAMSGGRETAGEPGHTIVEADGPDEVRKVTRRLLMYHSVDHIKLAATGSMGSDHVRAQDTQLTVAEMRAAVEEAHKVDRPVHVHAYGREGIENSLQAGVDAIVHGQSFTDDQLERMAESSTFFVPTLSIYRNQEFVDLVESSNEVEGASDDVDRILADTEPNFRRALEAGVPIAMGTDTGMPYTPHGANPQELRHMVECGMDESEAITAATMTAAEALGADDLLGSIEMGKAADFLVLSEDPLGDITVLTRSPIIERIMIGGQFLEDALDRHTN